MENKGQKNAADRVVLSFKTRLKKRTKSKPLPEIDNQKAPKGEQQKPRQRGGERNVTKNMEEHRGASITRIVNFLIGFLMIWDGLTQIGSSK